MRADVPAIAKLMDAPAEEVNATVEGLAQAGFDFLKDAAAGKWLSADLGALGDTFKGLAQQFAGGGATGGAPAAGTETTDGVKRRPSASAMTKGIPESTVATRELVVPRSIPMILLMPLPRVPR